MNHKLNKMLVDIGTEVNNHVPEVNSGGCGFYAYELIKRLQENNIDAKIVVYCDSDDFYYDDNANIQLKEEYLKTNKIAVSYMHNWCRYVDVGGFGHVKVEVNNKVYDSDGGVLVKRSSRWNWFRRMDGYLSVETLRKILRPKSNWNSRFNRKHVPKIRKIMDKYFEKYGFSA